MKKFTKFLSVFMTAIMTLGMLLPNMAFAADQKYDVQVHKLVMDSLEKFPLTDANEDGSITGLDEKTKYTGGLIDNITGFFGKDNNVEELDGISFTYWKVNDEQYKEMIDHSQKYKTVEQVNAYLKDEDNKGTETDKTANKEGVLVSGLAEGNYWFVENKENGLAEGELITGAAAVPFGLQLPVYKADGSTFTTGDNKLHVYPKNTKSEKPEVDKKLNDEVVNPGQTGLPENGVIKPVDYSVGDMVPFQITTKIKPGTKYQTAFWNDQMSEGLTFTEAKAGLTVTIDGTVLTKDTHYSVSDEGNGFEVKLIDAGLDFINDDKAHPGNEEGNNIITIDYSAELNEKAIVDVPEENTVIFHYGNNPGEGNTPIPGHPENKEITVNKKFETGNWPADLTVEVKLYCVENPTDAIATVELDASKTSHTFTKLDNDKEYFVEETYPKGYFANYSEIVNGVVTITNNKTDNPTPIKPNQPQVITYGRKFVKTNANGTERLTGAKFVIRNADSDEAQYLAVKSAEKAAAEIAAVATAKEKLETAITTYNALEKTAQTAEEKGKVDAAQKAYNDAFVAARAKYEWTSVEADAIELVSNAQGQFEITGLKEGQSYWLEETVAPQGYAKLTKRQEFTVGSKSYSKPGSGIDYVLESGKDDALQVVNKKITIPQTGGIGTAIFIIAGIALMGGAFVAMKKQEA